MTDIKSQLEALPVPMICGKCGPSHGTKGRTGRELVVVCQRCAGARVYGVVDSAPHLDEG